MNIVARYITAKFSPFGLTVAQLKEKDEEVQSRYPNARMELVGSFVVPSIGRLVLTGWEVVGYGRKYMKVRDPKSQKVVNANPLMGGWESGYRFIAEG